MAGELPKRSSRIEANSRVQSQKTEVSNSGNVEFSKIATGMNDSHDAYWFRGGIINDQQASCLHNPQMRFTEFGPGMAKLRQLNELPKLLFQARYDKPRVLRAFLNNADVTCYF